MPDQPETDAGESGGLRRPLTHTNFESAVDTLLNKARAAGQFENLQGQGQPLASEPEAALVPEELRAGYRMLKNAGYAPPWVEARRALEEQRAELAGWLRKANQRWPQLDDARRSALRAEYQRRLQELQREILHYNLTVPESAGQVPGVQLALELTKLGERT
jgi:hypothetical protein